MSAPTVPPGIMVSSTYYDLAQIRADLSEFIGELGYRPLLSEYPSFPIDPDTDAAENCRRRVERDADVLVLVIGGRYGYVDERAEKSITNLEYLSARAKGIPVFAFVDRSVASLIPVWEKNPTADLSHAVQDARVLAFIKRVRDEDRVWVQEFGRAQDIVGALRIQFAYLMREGLALRRVLASEGGVPEGLSGKSLRLAMDRPAGWEYLLFGQVLTDEVAALSGLRREHRLGISLGDGETMRLAEIPNWFEARIAELLRISSAANVLMNEELQHALGPPGKAGDAQAIASAARGIASAYRHAIEWAQRIRKAHTHECFTNVVTEFTKFSDGVITRIEEFGPHLLSEVRRALDDQETSRLELTLVIDVPANAFEAALEQATICYRRVLSGSRGWA